MGPFGDRHIGAGPRRVPRSPPRPAPSPAGDAAPAPSVDSARSPDPPSPLRGSRPSVRGPRWVASRAMGEVAAGGHGVTPESAWPYHVRPYPLAAALNASIGVTGVTSPCCRAVNESWRAMAVTSMGNGLRRAIGALFVVGAVAFERRRRRCCPQCSDWPDSRWEPTGVVLPAFVAGWPGHRSARTGLQGRQPQYREGPAPPGIRLVVAFGVGQVRTTVIGYSDWGARAAPVNSSCRVTTLAAASV